MATLAEARAERKGTVYEGESTADGLRELAAGGVVPRTFVFEGSHRVRLHLPDGGSAAWGCEPVAPTLEDYYFVRTMRSTGVVG